MSQSERIADKLDRPRTRQALHNWREGEEDENKSRRQDVLIIALICSCSVMVEYVTH